MSTEQINAAFEKWWDGPRVADPIPEGIFKRLARDAYLDAWAKSRAALVVELPSLLGDADNDDSDYTLGFNQATISIKKTIIAAGITVRDE